MANRLDRRRLNPGMSTYSKYDKAIGSWRANKPLWPGINVCQLKRPDIRMQSCHVCQIRLLANEEESIYGRSLLLFLIRIAILVKLAVSV